LRTRSVAPGTVTEAGEPVVHCEVFLFWRPNMMKIGRTLTDASGAWSFTKLDSTRSDYVAVAKDPVTGTQYNDIIYSMLTPV
jgi:hypothetical protein